MTTNPIAELVTTWSQLIPGDIIRGADGQNWEILDLIGALGPQKRVVMRNSSGRVAEGTVRTDSAVTVLNSTETRASVDAFAAAGLILTYHAEDQEHSA